MNSGKRIRSEFIQPCEGNTTLTTVKADTMFSVMDELVLTLQLNNCAENKKNNKEIQNTVVCHGNG